jgi:MFS family permease
MFDHITKDFLRNTRSIAIGFCFITIGLLFGGWATFVPFIKSKFNFDDAQLGILLLSMPFGALAMNPIAATFVRKLGMKNTTLLGFILLNFGFSLIFFQNTLYTLPLVLFICGSGISITNVAMNTCVGALEEFEGVKIMSTCHGLFSIGLMFGSLAASYASGVGVHPSFYMVGLAAGLCLIMFFAKPIIFRIHDKNADSSPEKARFNIPKGTFLWMIIISLCINITEGTMADWTAVYMRDIVKTSTYFIGFGLTGYSLFMALGRFLGDYLIPRFGPNKVLYIGSLLAMFGLILAISMPFTISSIVGFAFVGAGVSCGAPILYASAARTPNMPAGAGLAIMNTFAMGGFLFGPVIIGFISKLTTLQISFSCITCLCVVWFFYARRIQLF